MSRKASNQPIEARAGGLREGRTARWTEPWIVWTSLIALLPIAGVTVLLVLLSSFPPEVEWTVLALLVVSLVWMPIYLHHRLVGKLRSATSLALSLRDEDYSMRLEEGREEGALGELAEALNQLRDMLYRLRTGAVETDALLHKILDQIDVAVFAFDRKRRLTRVNDRGLGLLGRERHLALGRDAAELGLEACLVAETGSLIELEESKRSFFLQRSSFRDRGSAHSLLTLSDLTWALRRKELEAWQRMVRVLRHEISNALAPMSSYAQNLLWILQQDPMPDDWRGAFGEGLEVIEGRIGALSRMLSRYRELTDLPVPRKKQIGVAALVDRAIALETRRSIEIESGPDPLIEVDPDQITQLLVNLINNAVEALDESGSTIGIRWAIDAVSGSGGSATDLLHLVVEDDGPGLASSENLFVPFFTTKVRGSGIGLALSRQIAEAHGGSLRLDPSPSGGCCATLSLPIAQE